MVLSSDDVEKFIKDAQDNQYLATKVGLIFGVTGACRIQVLAKISIKDVENHVQVPTFNDCILYITYLYTRIMKRLNTMSICPLSAALRKKAEEELHETPSRVSEDIQTLRDWIKQQPHLHSIQPTDQWLVAFLRGSKYDMMKAQGKIDMYYKYKATLPEFYANRDPLDPGLQELLKCGVLLPLKCESDGSPKILLTRVATFCESSRPLSDLLKVCLMIVEILFLEDDNFSIAGTGSLLDAEDVSLSLLWQWTPSMANKLFSCLLKSYTVRIKCMHIINAPFYMGAAITLFKVFAGSKLRKRVFTHGKDLETLYGHLDKSILPKEYGGTDGTVDELIEYWKTKVESYREWFLEENACSDESKRPKK